MDRFVDVAVASARQREDVLARLFLDDVDDVVDRDHPDEAAGTINHGRRNKRVFLKAERHLLLIHVDREQRLLALHHIGDGDVRGRAQQPREFAGADRMMAGIDHEHFPEIGGEILVAAEIVEDVADPPMFRHRDQVALHQAAGGFLGVGQSLLDRGAIVGIERAQHGAAIVLVHVLDDRDRVVGIQFGGERGDLIGIERAEHGVAHPVVHLGQHVAVEQFGERGRQRLAHVAGHQFKQIGDVGRMERADQRARAFLILFVDALDDGGDEIVGEDIVVVVARLGDSGLFRRDDDVFEVGVAHRADSMSPRVGAS